MVGLETRAQRIAAAAVAVLLGAAGFVPLFGGPGYEQSLASGLVVPSAAAIATALDVSAEAAMDPLGAVGRGLSTGAVLAAIAWLTAIAHGLRVGMCDAAGGTLFFALTAGFGALLGGGWGAVAGEIARRVRRRRLLCVLLSLAAPLCGIAVSVARFYATPMIFAFDPFFGFFSGALYDTVVDVRTALWSYRAGTAATLAGLALCAAAATRDDAGRLTLRLGTGARSSASERGRAIACAVLGASCFAASAGVAVEGPALGHWQTSRTIARALGARASGPRCDVVYPDSVLPADAILLVRDCEEELTADEARLGVKLGGRLTEFVFADAGQKRALMGAAETSIAKPWRREVYVQLARYPHPVLGHEIAHVVAGAMAPGPFHVGGGLWPDPGLIEGIAVATSPDDDELTDAQWARAMLDLDALPPSSELFSLGFLEQNGPKSYTAAGAFIGWAMDTWGLEKVRAWYGGASIEALTGQRWPALDQAFRQSLRGIPMPPDASAYARARFDRPSVWGRRCPHVVDALDRAGDGCRDDHRFERAQVFYAKALSVDPHDLHAQLDRAAVAMRYGSNGDADKQRAALRALASDAAVPRTARDWAEEALADDALLHGDDARAAGAYRDIAGRTLNEDAARTLEVKAFAATDAEARSAVIELLIGTPERGTVGPVDAWGGALALGTWLGRADAPLASYLAGKNLAQRGEWARAAEALDHARDADAARGDSAGGSLTSTSLGDRVRRELLRERAVVACALEDEAAERRVRAEVTAPGSPFSGGSSGRRDWVLRLLARCDRAPGSR